MAVEVRDFHDSHGALRSRADELVRVARRLPHATPEERRAGRDSAVDFLRGDVEPHMRLDERVMYPEVAARLRSQFATASMSYDHIAIRHWIDELAGADDADVERLQELLYGLHALIRVHIWKETELFLAALESPAWPVSA